MHARSLPVTVTVAVSGMETFYWSDRLSVPLVCIQPVALAGCVCPAFPISAELTCFKVHAGSSIGFCYCIFTLFLIRSIIFAAVMCTFRHAGLKIKFYSLVLYKIICHLNVLIQWMRVVWSCSWLWSWSWSRSWSCVVTDQLLCPVCRSSARTASSARPTGRPSRPAPSPTLP